MAKCFVLQDELHPTPAENNRVVLVFSSPLLIYREVSKAVLVKMRTWIGELHCNHLRSVALDVMPSVLTNNCHFHLEWMSSFSQVGE